jgi:hypothetical protein
VPAFVPSAAPAACERPSNCPRLIAPAFYLAPGEYTGGDPRGFGIPLVRSELPAFLRPTLFVPSSHIALGVFTGG